MGREGGSLTSDTSPEHLQQLARIPLFSRLDAGELERVVAGCEELSLQAGSKLLEAGEKGDAFFVVLSGRLETWAGGAEGGFVAHVNPGELVGERALILDEPRQASVQAGEDSRVLRVPREVYERFLASNAAVRSYLDEVRRERRLQILGRNPLCSLLGPRELEDLEPLLEERIVERGEVVFSIGDPGDSLLIILSGELEVWLGDPPQLVGHLGPPNSFGERALLRNEPRSATVKVASRARMLMLGRELFERFFMRSERALEYFEELLSDRHIQTLEQIPLFSYLAPEELRAVRGLFKEVTLPRDSVVCEVGDEGEEFYVVRSGELEVWGGERGRELLDTIKPPGFFGEESLLLGEPRRATVRVSQEARLLVLEKDAFTRFFLNNQRAIAYLEQVRYRRRTAALERIPLFKMVEAEDLEQIQGEFVEERYRKGDVVCRAGDDSTTFYIVLSGELEVWSGGDSASRLARLWPGDFFGELAVILGEKRSATVVAAQKTQLLGLPKQAFTRLFMHNPRSLEYFSRVMCQRLASTVTGERVGEGTVQIAVSAAPGLRGKTLLARSLATVLAEITGSNVLLVRTRTDPASEPAPGLHLQLSNFRRSVDSVRRNIQLVLAAVGRRPSWEAVGAPEPIELTLDIAPGSTAEQYGGELSDLVNRFREDFQYQVFDLVSEPAAIRAAARDFVDVTIDIVDAAEPRFAEPEETREAAAIREYPVVNLHNPTSRRMPINACVPFVIPDVPGLSAESVLADPRSPGARPIWRLARKVLGRSVGLALGGGAAFGLSHLGVLKVLEENQIPVDLLVGCSIGSLVAVSYAAGYPLEQIIERAHDMSRREYMMRGLDLSLGRPGLIAGDKLKSRFSPLLGEHRTFEDLVIPCRTVATDVRSGELVTIGRGALEDAYRSSIAVPLVLAPQPLDDRVLVDGGVADPVPAETARHMGADLCIAVHVVPPLKKGVETAIAKWSARLNRLNPFSYFGSVADMPNSFDITMNALQTLQYELGLYKIISADVAIRPELSDFTWTDFGRSHELIERGVEAATAALPDLRRLLRPGAKKKQ